MEPLNLHANRAASVPGNWRRGLQAILPITIHVTYSEMSSIFPLQCLFCKRLNPEGAAFCNECGTQLNMQPCEQCGAIDARAARNCYKCGAEFPPPTPPGVDPDLRPAIPAENPLKSHDAVTVAQQQAEQQNHGTTHVYPELQAASEIAPAKTGAVPAGLRRRWLIAAVALSVVLIAGLVSIYLQDGRPASLAQKQDVKQTAPDVSSRPNNPARPAPSAKSAETDVALTPTRVATKPAAGNDGLDKSPAPAQLNAGVAPALRPASASDADVKIRQPPSILKECPQAVATLGLCGSDTRAEKR